MMAHGDEDLAKALKEISVYITSDETEEFRDSAFFGSIGVCVEVIGRHLGQLYPNLPAPYATDDIQLAEAVANLRADLRVAEDIVGREGVVFSAVYEHAEKIIDEVGRIQSGSKYERAIDNPQLRQAMDNLKQSLAKGARTMENSNFFMEIQRHAMIIAKHEAFRSSNKSSVHTVQEAVVELQRIMDEAKDVVGNGAVYKELERLVNQVLRNTVNIPIEDPTEWSRMMRQKAYLRQIRPEGAHIWEALVAICAVATSYFCASLFPLIDPRLETVGWVFAVACVSMTFYMLWEGLNPLIPDNYGSTIGHSRHIGNDPSRGHGVFGANTSNTTQSLLLSGQHLPQAVPRRTLDSIKGGVLRMPNADERARLFRKLDKAGNGVLVPGQVASALVKLWPEFGHNHERASHVFTTAFYASDFNHEGYVGRDEFKQLLMNIVFFNTHWETFSHIQTDHNGRMSFEEFERACDLSHLNMQLNMTDKNESKRIYEALDDHDSGKVSAQEFQAWCCRRAVTINHPDMPDTTRDGSSPRKIRRGPFPPANMSPISSPTPSPTAAPKMGQPNTGKLTLSVKAARGLKKMDRFGSADPFVEIHVGSQRQTSEVVKNSRDPVWNAEFKFDDVGANTYVNIYMYDWDKLSKKDPMGKVVLRMEDICLHAHAAETWIALTRMEGCKDPQGELLLGATADFPGMQKNTGTPNMQQYTPSHTSPMVDPPFNPSKDFNLKPSPQPQPEPEPEPTYEEIGSPNLNASFDSAMSDRTSPSQSPARESTGAVSPSSSYADVITLLVNDMQFPEEQARKAVQQTNGDMTAAVRILTSQS